MSRQDWADRAARLSIATGLFIDGRYCPARGSETFDCVNPATGETLAVMARGQAAEVDAAVASGQAAWRDGRSTTQGEWT